MIKNDLEYYNENAANWWDEKSQIYKLYHLNIPRFEFFDRTITNWTRLKILDVGCGGGFTTEFLASRGSCVSGIDLSVECIKIAQEHAKVSGYAIDYRQGVAENLPYDDNTFDGVICVDVLEHVADPQKVVREIHRVLKPNGVYFFDTINRTFLSKVIMIWLLENILREIKPGVHDWEKFIKPEELSRWLHETGFKEIEIKGFDPFAGALNFTLSPAKNFQKIANFIEFKKTGRLKAEITDDTSIMYIGRAIKI